MKGLQTLFFGILGIFAFSWLGLTVVPNIQIGSLNPQMDEDGGDVYPWPASGMAQRGAQVYAANGCVYCHSQQVRPDYGGSDLARKSDYDPNHKWGDRRSAPRDYIFEPIVFLGKMRVGPDLANVGYRGALQETGVATPAPGAAPAAASAAASPAVSAAPATTAAASPSLGASPVAAVAVAAAGVPGAAPSSGPEASQLTADGKPLPYTAAWHHRHLYNPRSVNEDSDMPAYHFLYEKRRISGVISPDAINFTDDENDKPAAGWEIVPSYDAKCLVAYLMSRDQSHPLKEARSPVIAAAPAREAQK